jgi:hypothetical protein
MEIEKNTTETAIQVSGDFNFTELLAKSENLSKLKPVMNLTADYIELEKPSYSFRGIFIGIGEINVTDKVTGELKSIEASRFLVDKQVKINAGVSLVRETKNVPVGTAVQVTYERKEGNVKIYSIALLG